MIEKFVSLIQVEHVASKMTPALRQAELHKTCALQNAILNKVEVSSITTDEKGVIQLVNLGAERMLGYTAAEITNRMTLADIIDPQEVIQRASAFSAKLAATMTPGPEALSLEISPGIEGVYELGFIRKDGSRFPANVTVESLLDAQNKLIGYLLIVRDDTLRKQDEGILRLRENQSRILLESIDEGYCIIEKIEGETDELDFRFIEANRAFLMQTDLSNVVGKTLREVSPDVLIVDPLIYDSVLKTGQSVKFERGLLSGNVLEFSAYRIDDLTPHRIGITFKDITIHKSAVKQLRASHDTFSNLIKNAAFGVFIVDAQLRVFKASITAEKAHGHIKPFVGRDLKEILRTTWPEPFASDVIGRFHHTLETGESYINHDTTQLRKNVAEVESYDWRVDRITLPDGQFGVVCYFDDITERKQTEEALGKSDESYRNLFKDLGKFASVAHQATQYLNAEKEFNRSIIDSSPDCIKVLDLEGNLLSMLSGQALLGIDNILPFLNKSWILFWEGDDRQAARVAVEEAAAGRQGRFVGFFRTMSGDPKWWDVTVSPILDTNGKPAQLLSISRDVTERKQYETNLNKAIAEAKKANLAKSDFLSSMSHELRTPLHAILGFAQLLQIGLKAPTPSQEESLGHILKGGWYLLELINEILDLSVIESGKVSLSLEPVSVDEVMVECRSMIESQAHKRGILVTFHKFDNSWLVMADRIRLKQVLVNLLSNAIKYNQNEGTVEVHVSCIEDRIQISVADTGLGLSPEKLEQLFQPFNRLGQEASDVEGTGIGLIVTKRLVKLMGGEIGVESTVGVGSVFWIKLTLSAAPQIVASGQPKLIAPATVENGISLRKLLYVEDNQANLKLVEQLMELRPDMHLFSVADGHLSIELAREIQPAVILMDINLPGISGIEVLKLLRQDPLTAHIPVIALSANAHPHDIQEGLKAGFFRYITKPIKVNEFMSTVTEAFEFAERESLRNHKSD